MTEIYTPEHKFVALDLAALCQFREGLVEPVK
jgi:hypothetical protein